MTGSAAAAILNGMPHPADLRARHHDGTTLVTAGQMIVSCYPDGDIAMRNMAVAVARQLGFSGQRVAQVMGLSASYVATLHQRARREGAAGLVRPSGPKPKLSPEHWARAARWRQAGASEAQIAARLGVAQATVSRHLAGAGQQQLTFGGEPGRAAGQDGAPAESGSADQEPRQPGPRREEPAPGPAAQPEPAQAPAQAPAAEQQPEPAESGPAPEPVAQPGPEPAPEPGLETALAAGLLAAGARITRGQVTSRYAGAMLLHAFGARAGAGDILAAAGDGGPGGRRFADVALLSAVSTCFALGAMTVEQFGSSCSPVGHDPVRDQDLYRQGPGPRTRRRRRRRWHGDIRRALEAPALPARSRRASGLVQSGHHGYPECALCRPGISAHPLAPDRRGRIPPGLALAVAGDAGAAQTLSTPITRPALPRAADYRVAPGGRVRPVADPPQARRPRQAAARNPAGILATGTTTSALPLALLLEKMFARSTGLAIGNHTGHFVRKDGIHGGGGCR